MTTPFRTVRDILLSGYEVGSTSKEASSKTLTKEATQAETALEGEQYYDTTNLISSMGYTPPPNVKVPSTLSQAIQDVETGQANLTGWTAPPTPPTSPSIPWWVYLIIGIIAIGVIVALVV